MRDKEQIAKENAAWLDIDKRALLLDRRAIAFVVGALRRYRTASEKLLDARYRDGFVDGVGTSDFETETELIGSDAIEEAD